MISTTYKFAARAKAFTLVELLMVVVIVSIVGAIALPRYGNAVAQYRLDAAAKRIVADIDYARALAMSTSQSRSIIFSPAYQTYSIANVTSLDNRSTTYTVNLNAEPYKSSLVSATFGGSSTITFDPYGTPSSGGTVVVRTPTTQKTITIDATTGKATFP